MNGAGEPAKRSGSFRDAGDQGVGTELNKPVPGGKTAWFCFDNEQPWPAVVRHSEASCDGGFRVGASVLASEDDSSDSGWGPVRLEWFHAEGSLRAGSANIRSGSEGCLELSANKETPTGDLILLKGAEVCRLSLARRCEPSGDRYFAEVEVLTESAPKYNTLAA